MRPRSPPPDTIWGSQLLCGEHMEGKGGSGTDGGHSALEGSVLPISGARDEHQTFSTQQEQMFLWRNWCSWGLGAGDIWCPL